MGKKVTIPIAATLKSLEKGQNTVFLRTNAKYSVISSTITRLQNDEIGRYSLKKVSAGVMVTRTA